MERLPERLERKLVKLGHALIEHRCAHLLVATEKVHHYPRGLTEK